MKNTYRAQKWAALAALRQGSWVALGDWGAVAAIETLTSLPEGGISGALLPSAFFPGQTVKKIGGTHFYAELASKALPPIPWGSDSFDPSLWQVKPWPEEEEAILLSSLALVKEAALLPFLLLARQRGDLAAMRIAPEALPLLKDAQMEWNIAARAMIPLAQGEAEMIAFRPEDGGAEQIALLFGPPKDVPLVRLHSQCFTGDVFGSRRCDCGQQLQGAMDLLAKAPQGGVLLYLTQEGRGIGLVNKLRAYRLQDEGMDTLDANLHLGFGADERDYEAAASMLKKLGFYTIDLISNNPAKRDALTQHGVTVRKMVRHIFPANRHNESYLATKQRRFGHLF